jgi:hypothetical protein
MATLRDRVRQRRNDYLDRVSQFFDRSEPNDTRVAYARGFLEGGDDLPPDCVNAGVTVQRRRLWWIAPEESAAAKDRHDTPKKIERSTEADWDKWAAGTGAGFNLYRTTVNLVHACEQFRAGVELPASAVFDLHWTALPSLDTVENAVPNAWALLQMCGLDENLLKRVYKPALDAVVTMKTDVFNFDLRDWLEKRVGAFLNHTRDTTVVPNPFQDKPLASPEDDPRCPCRRGPPKPPDSSPSSGTPKQDPVRPTLAAAMTFAVDPVLAAAAVGENAAVQSVVDEMRFIGADDDAIAQLLQWISDRWAKLPADSSTRFVAAGEQWRAQHPELKPPGWDKKPGEEEDRTRQPVRPPIDYPLIEAWKKDNVAFHRFRSVPRFFMKLSSQATRGVLREVVKSLWPDEDSAPYDDDTLDAADDLERDDFLAAVDRATDSSRQDVPFRLVALLQQPKAYFRVLDKDGVEDGMGANRLARPTLDPLSAYLWRTTVCHSTIGHILTMIDTADFHMAEHIRFLGLFRPGGTLRTMAPGDDKYDLWLSQLVPRWFTDFLTAALLRVKYWLEDRALDRENEEEMTYWSENHQILFASSEYLAATFFSIEQFAYNNQPAAWHSARALVRVRGWLAHRLRLGFAEQNSGVYYNQHLPAIFNLADFAPDADVKKKALMVLDLMVFDIVRRTCQGGFVAASGRAYWGSKRDGWSNSLLSFIELITGQVGDHLDAQESSAAAFSTSTYLDEIPEALLAVAADTAAPRVDRSRTSINLDETNDYGVDLDTSEGLVFWWGCGAYFTEETYHATQNWSYRWHLRHTGPFKLFKWIDMAIMRLITAVLSVLFAALDFGILTMLTGIGSAFAGLLAGAAGGGAAGAAASEAVGFPMRTMTAVMVNAKSLRRIYDVFTSVADVVIGVGAWALKEVGVLDENDDRVRVARPALEQEFRELAIQFNAGSVLQREHCYTWRAEDAMLSSLEDFAKGATAFQTEPCIATLGMNVCVFTGKRPKTDDENDFGSKVGAAAENYLEGEARYAYDPETFYSQFEIAGGESAPELGGAMAPFLASTAFADDGPMYWFGSMSGPLAFQHENVAISIYRPNDLQESLCPESTHAHWPFDHFDEFRSQAQNGGRWLFGRRDRRFPPRMPCEPRPERRPAAGGAWPEGKWREEGGAGSGYVALFSARELKTLPGTAYASREVEASGHRNVWITVVGDRSTYGSFDAFCSDVLNASIDDNVDDGRCSITMPIPGGADRQQKGKTFSVAWEGGASFDGKPLSTDDWPRFEWKTSVIKRATALQVARSGLRIDDVQLRGSKSSSPGRVDWNDTAWTLQVVVRSWQEAQLDEYRTGRKAWIEVPAQLTLRHDFSDLDHPVRETSPNGIDVLYEALRMATKPTALARTPTVSEPLAADFRKVRSTWTRLRGER